MSPSALAKSNAWFSADFGPEWREIRDASTKPTVGLPFKDCLTAVKGSPLDPATISADAGSPRFTRPNGAFAASTALVTTSPEQAAALYTMATSPTFASCIATYTIDFRANPPVSADGGQNLPTNITAGESTGSRLNVVYPGQGDKNESFVADFMVVKVDRALLALWFANPGAPTVQADEDAVVKALVERLTTLPDKNNLGATSGPATTAVATTGAPAAGS